MFKYIFFPKNLTKKNLETLFLDKFSFLILSNRKLI
jgi:hypothetical protein